MLECCILFLHHKDDETTRYHLDLLRRGNPYPVVAVCDASAERVEGAIDVDVLTKEWASEDKWGGIDTVLYRWFRHGGLRAERYVFFEWDTLATMPVKEYFGALWDEDAAGASTMLIERDPDWWWFHQLDRLPPHVRDVAAGIVPLSGLLLSDRALAAVASSAIPADVYCELRLGTLLRAAGFTLSEYPPETQRMNQWHRDLIVYDADKPGIYHPIKERMLAGQPP